MSLYLKYRSKTFDDVVEQDYTKSILKQQVLKSLEWEQFSNYLFYGSRGIGKTSVARIVARSLNCLDNTLGNPCNQCESCKLILSNRSTDIVEIDAASNTGVDNIRDEIINKAMYPPVQLKKKVYIIDEVHMLSTGAFNALLKIMEEPPSYLVFILATTELHKVPDTIISRCQLFHFKRITTQGIVKRLEHICGVEWFQYTTTWLEIIARLADGGMRDAIKYLDQVSILWLIDEKTVSQCLGVTSDAVIKEFVDIVASGNSKEGVHFISRLQENSIDIYVFLKDVLHYLDVHITVDTMGTLLPVVHFVKSVYEKIKYFPHPMVLIKAEFAEIASNPWVAEDTRSKAQGKLEETKSSDASWWSWDQPWMSEEKGEAEVLQELQESKKTKRLEPDFDELKDRIVRNVSSQSIKSIWESACYIDSIRDNLLKVCVIEKGKLILLNIPKNKQDVEMVCSEIFDKPIQIEYEFIEKEQFLRRWLWGLVA